MIENRLTGNELKKILLPIIKLKPLLTVISDIGSVFNIESKSPEDIVCQTQYLIIYKNYKIDITFLDEINGEGVSVAVQFKAKQKWWHIFFNQNRSIIKHLKQTCQEEFYQLRFKQFEHFIPETIREPKINLIYFHDELAYNGKWEEAFEISPLIVAEDTHHGNCFVSFHFNANCYQRIKNKTILKMEWKDHIQDVVKYINKEATRRMQIKKE